MGVESSSTEKWLGLEKGVHPDLIRYLSLFLSATLSRRVSQADIGEEQVMGEELLGLK